MRLMGLKSVTRLASVFFGSRTIFAEFSSSKPWELSMNMLFSAAVMSSLIISQQDLKKAPVNPSGPGALSDGMELIMCFISSCVNAVPALGVGHEVRRPRAQVEEGPKPRYTNP